MNAILRLLFCRFYMQTQKLIAARNENHHSFLYLKVVRKYHSVFFTTVHLSNVAANQAVVRENLKEREINTLNINNFNRNI